MSLTSAENSSGATSADTRTRVNALLCTAVGCSLLLLALAAFMWHAEATYTGESLGLGYVFAILAAAPAALALVLALAAFFVRRRFARTATVLAWCAAGVAVAPVALVMFSSLFSF